MNWKTKPFLLSPAGKDYLWGGNRLKTEFNKEIDLVPLAETWECSTHPDGPSVIVTGEYAGKTLAELLKEHPEYLGKHPGTEGELPVLIKFIDAKKNLSVQVHPDDAYAWEYENGQLGKTEMWYVMDAAPDAQLVYGFSHDITKEQLRKSLEDGTVEKYLQKVKIQKDDVFFIEAGTVHAIGAGALIAEIQESSNLTYRLYDYKRVGKDGKLRELHIDKALDVANLKSSSEPRQPLRLLKYKKGSATELLCRCKYFQVERYLLNTESSRKLVEFQTAGDTFQVFLCLDGCGVVFMEDGDSINFFKGDCIFVPANSLSMKFHGKAQFLHVRC
ncbi:MAG TPA: mannose-6-phosphate isomerase, class I [Roseburia sp.]|nr:mannose-6-phosphate isomerase, class I [Roseburia sp.]